MMRSKVTKNVTFLAIFVLCLVLLFYRYLFKHEGPSNNTLGFSLRELQLADRVRTLKYDNRVLQGQIEISQKQLSSYLDIRGGNRRTLGDDHTDSSCADQRHHEVPKCEVLHITIVCAGIANSRTLVTLIKSLLFYRRNPIHFHFVTDPTAKDILDTLFKSWNVVQVQVSFYSTGEMEREVEWIPNKHYSGIFGLLKLTLPKILPLNVTRSIVLDTDIILAADIAELWSLFHDFEDENCFGFVENQSDWYLPGKLWKSHSPWPALDRGFNSGVILMDLRKMRNLKWNQLWRVVAERDLLTHFATSLADQDIFNAVIKHHPHMVHVIPCYWNVQLSDHGRAEELCYGRNNRSEVLHGGPLKAIHFNSPRKVEVRTKHSEYFKNHFLTFEQYDGNLLRKFLRNFDCKSSDSTTTAHDEQDVNIIEDDPCHELNSVQTRTYRTHIFYLDCSYESEEASDVTLVAQLSMDRLHMIESLGNLWSGPISLAIYLSDAEATQFLIFVENSEILKTRKNIGYHVVFKEGLSYPVNYMRNVALKNAQTDFVFLSDVDFLPGSQVYSNLKKVINSSSQEMFTQDRNQKMALIVPAFETQRYRIDNFPTTKAEVLNLLDLGTLLTFRYHVWSEGHRTTNFARWKTATKPYRVKWETNFEPYVVVKKSSVPFYDERFSGFGWNKVSHIMNLEALGFTFVVLPNVFVVHMPHAPSLDIARFRSSDLYRKCLNILKQTFVTELNQNYSKDFKTA